MAASVVSLAPARTEPAVPRPVSPAALDQAPVREHTWHGASGRQYVHTVYSLIACPPLPKACYALVRRDHRGARSVLHIGLGQDDAPTLNLARVRQRGAQLGANEVHVHFLAASDAERSLAACDLRTGQFGALESEPLHAAA
jgi:hypothetical protein